MVQWSIVWEFNARGFHDYCDPSRLDSLLHTKGDLFRETFLHLEAATESLSDACEF